MLFSSLQDALSNVPQVMLSWRTLLCDENLLWLHLIGIQIDVKIFCFYIVKWLVCIMDGMSKKTNIANVPIMVPAHYVVMIQFWLGN